MTLCLATLAAGPIVQAIPAEWTHSVIVSNGGVTSTAIYTAKPTMTSLEIGMTPGRRPSTMRGTRSADIAVDRRAGDTAADARTIGSQKRLNGSRHGSCQQNRREIDREIAGKSPEINAHLLTVAQGDQQQLRAGINARSPSSTN